MKITYENITHNAERMINELTEELYEYCGAEYENLRIATLGEIKGICAFAECMKEVLVE